MEEFFLMVLYMHNSLSRTSGTEVRKHLELNPMLNPKGKGNVLLPHLYPDCVKQLESVKYIVLTY